MRKNIKQLISIIAISFLSLCLFAGLTSNANNILERQNNLYEKTNLADVYVTTTGLTDDDRTAMRTLYNIDLIEERIYLTANVKNSNVYFVSTEASPKLSHPLIKEGEEESVWNLTTGRQATVENAIKAADMGVDMIVLTGNPGVGVDNEAIMQALSKLKDAVGDRVILTAGKMHASGIISEAGEKILTEKDVEAFVDAGADVILLPAPGTVPGITMEYAGKLIKKAHEKGALAMTTIGTSQEGADEDTIRQIALMCKMAGADIHHIGDSGYMGMALPENITAYSVAIRGKRHTYRRMAMSLLR